MTDVMAPRPISAATRSVLAAVMDLQGMTAGSVHSIQLCYASVIQCLSYVIVRSWVQLPMGSLFNDYHSNR